LLEEAGAGITVSDAGELAREVIDLFEHPGELSRRGELGRNALLSHRHAAARHAKVILRLIRNRVRPDEKNHFRIETGYI
jgi:UDP-N-acetylglucosamine:LPS N-acetylglucosamine transferase